MSAPYDLLFADAGNAASTRLWKALGGYELESTRIGWYRTLRPAARLVQRAARSARALAQPIDYAAARLMPGRFGVVTPAGSTAPLLPKLIAAQHEKLMERRSIHARYTGDAVTWLLERLDEKYGTGAVRARMVHDEDGRVAGWFVYGIRDDAAVLVQLVAGPNDRTLVVDHLLHDVRTAGLCAVSGRLELNAPEIVTARGARLQLRDSGTVIHTHDRDLARVALGGAVQITGLDGEWWMSF